LSNRPSFGNLVRWLPLAGIMLAVGCTRTDVLLNPPGQSSGTLPALQAKSIPAPVLSSLKASAPTIATCAPATVYPLTDGTRTAGTVSVSNDATNLYVTYYTPSTYWWVANTQLAVASTSAGIPRDASGAASPWDFPSGAAHEPPIKSVTYTIALSKVGVQAGQTAYLSAMAGVVHPTTESEAGLEGSWEWLVMWGVGNTTTTAKDVIHAYTVASCGGTVTPPPPPPPPATKGVITITFDDGFATTYSNAYPVLRDLGLRGNAAVNPTPINEGWGDYMKPAQVQALWTAGWAVVSHTMDHQDLTTLSAAAMEAEIRDSKAWIEAKGYGPATAFVVPFHSWGARERAMIQKYHTYTRGHTIDEFSPERFATWPVTQPMDINAFEPEYAPYRTAQGRALTMAKVKYAIDNGLYLDLMFHKVPAATLPQFKELMTSIATTYKANVVTWKEIAK
jgi:peptidoglycan/xylan/chitin deacetylase (PgdA/CDA1 family)